MKYYRWPAIVCIAILIVWQYARKDKQAAAHSENQNTIRILSYNVRNSKGMDGVTDYNRTATLINQISPQVVAIQELDSATHRSNNTYVLQELAKRTDMYATFSPSIAYDGGKYGIGILSRERPITSKAIALPGKKEKRSMLLVEFKHYIVCCVHLSLTAEDRVASVPLINQCIEPYYKLAFLVGDFNAEPGSETIAAFNESWTTLSNTNQLTFPSNKPDRCIDYIMVRPATSVKLIDASVVKDTITSDHRPLYVDVTLVKQFSI